MTTMFLTGESAMAQMARTLETCPGCLQETDCPRGLVCWHCFKVQDRQGVPPLKYSGMSFEAWLAAYNPRGYAWLKAKSETAIG